MKKNLFPVFIALAVFAVPVLATESAVPAEKKAPMCGAFGEYRQLSKDDEKLFSTVMTAQKTGKKYFPIGVASQVVAGTNFKFKCVEEAPIGFASCRLCTVSIFQPLPNRGNAELSSVDYVPAKKDDAVFLKNVAPYVSALRNVKAFFLSIKDRASADAAAAELDKKNAEAVKAQDEFFKFSKEYHDKLEISADLGIYTVWIRRDCRRAVMLHLQEVAGKHKWFGSEKLEKSLNGEKRKTLIFSNPER